MSRHAPLARLLLIPLLVLTVVLSACSGDSKEDEATGTTQSAPRATTGTTAPTGTAIPSETTTSTTVAPTDTTAPTTVAPPEVTDPGVEPAGLIAAYTAAFTQTCNNIWAISPNGILYDPDDEEQTPYTVSDCLDEMVEEDGEIAESPEEAFELGVEAANDAAYFLTSGDQLCNGSRCWTYQ